MKYVVAGTNGDANRDGFVNGLDVSVYYNNARPYSGDMYGLYQQAGTGSSVPEPTTTGMILCAFGILGAMGVRGIRGPGIV